MLTPIFRVVLLYNKTTKLCKKFPLCKNLHKKYAAFFKAAHKKRSLDLCCHAFESQNTIKEITIKACAFLQAQSSLIVFKIRGKYILSYCFEKVNEKIKNTAFVFENGIYIKSKWFFEYFQVSNR